MQDNKKQAVVSVRKNVCHGNMLQVKLTILTSKVTEINFIKRH